MLCYCTHACSFTATQLHLHDYVNQQHLHSLQPRVLENPLLSYSLDQRSSNLFLNTHNLACPMPRQSGSTSAHTCKEEKTNNSAVDFLHAENAELNNCISCTLLLQFWGIQNMRLADAGYGEIAIQSLVYSRYIIFHRLLWN